MEFYCYSGPYPVPGLKILRIRRIEQSAVPLCMAWYPQAGTESFLVTANSQVSHVSLYVYVGDDDISSACLSSAVQV